MNDNHPPGNWPDRAIGLGAGLASALLYAASTRGTSLALALAYFVPLPVMIGALGFSPATALAGSVVGAFVLAHLGEPVLGVLFFLVFAAPALIAATAARASFPARGGDASPLPRHFSPGALLAILLLVTVLCAWAGLGALADLFKGFDAALVELARRFEPALDAWAQLLGKFVSVKLDGDEMKRLILLALLASVAAVQTLLLAVNLWIAARAVEISGRLGRSWPDLPEHLVLPRIVAPLFVIACGVSFDGGLPGALAGALAVAAGLVLAIQGLAALHAFSRPSKYRGLLLSALYAAVLALWPVSVMALTLFGLVESVLSLRARKARRLSRQSSKPETEKT